MQKSIDLSVIIPCCNAEKNISIQLDALAGQDWDGSWELVIVDNGSVDSTLEIVKKYKGKLPDLKVIRALEKKGSGYARNIGVTAAQGEKIVFCDSDDRVCKGWLRAMADALEGHAFVAGAITLEGLNETWRVPESTPFGVKGSPQKDVFVSRFNPSVRFAPACNMGIRKDLHMKIGGFDESILFNVDYDYCWKVWLAGFKLAFVPQALVEYRLRHDLAETFKQRYRWGKWSILIYRKYVGKGNLFDKFKFLFGGWRYLPFTLIRLRNKSDLFELVSWLGGRIGEVHGCLEFLVMSSEINSA